MTDSLLAMYHEHRWRQRKDTVGGGEASAATGPTVSGAKEFSRTKSTYFAKKSITNVMNIVKVLTMRRNLSADRGLDKIVADAITDHEVLFWGGIFFTTSYSMFYT